MKHQEARFSHVYGNSKRRIVSGQFRPGGKLPSSRNLCEEYNVGIATITRTLDTLEVGGLIDIQIRRVPVVPSRDLQIPGMSTTLEQRDYTLQAYETYELLLPYLLVFVARSCSIEIMPHYRQAQRAARPGVNVEGWKALIALARDILGTSQNPPLYDLHTVFEPQDNFAYFLEKSIYSWRSTRSRPASEPKSIIAVSQERNPVEQFYYLKVPYRDVHDIVSEVFNQMSDSVSTVPAQVPNTFEWNPLRGENYYYTCIVHDPTRKIGMNIYTAGSYLPYEVQLIEQHSVSAYTVKKALGLLEHRGYTKTLNGKGTVVLTPDQFNTERALLGFTARQEVLIYLHSLQLMTFLSHPAAVYTAPQFNADDSDQLTAHIKKPGIFLTDLFQITLERLSLRPLDVIWTEISRITKWEFYLTSYLRGVGVIEQLNEITRNAYQCLCKGNREALVKNLVDSYRLILSSVQAYTVEKYKFAEALPIKVP